MRYLTNLKVLLVFSWVLLWMSGCEEDPKFREYVYPMPEVTEMYPVSGYPTQQVTILGTNFGDRVEPVKVFFGEIAAENILSCKNNCIVVEVPENAVSGDVRLQTWANPAITIGSFTVYPIPVIASVVSDNADFGPGVAAPGDVVTITGTGFGTDESSVSVSFNGTPAEIISLSDTQITVVTPEGYLSGAVLVTVNGLTLTGSGLMNPDATGDVSMFYLKNYKRPFVQEDYVAGQAGDGSMAIPKDWILNEAAKCFVNRNADAAAGRVGGMFPKANALGLQVGWGGSGSASSITDGKMYQATTIPAGKYRLEITYIECNVSSDKTYIVVSEGDGIPNSDQVESSAIAYSKFSKNIGASDQPVTDVIEFSLESTTQLSIGFVATFGNNKYFKVSDIKLILESHE